MGERRREANETRLLVDCGRLNRRDLVAAEGLSYDVESARQCRIAKGLIMIARVGRPDGRNERLLWILVSSACALASAAAIAPIDSLDCCMVLLRRDEIETDRP